MKQLTTVEMNQVAGGLKAEWVLGGLVAVGAGLIALAAAPELAGAAAVMYFAGADITGGAGLAGIYEGLTN